MAQCFIHSHFTRVTARCAPLVLVAGMAFAPALHAALVYDTFTGADNTALIGRMPSPTDVPGNAYAGNGNVSLTGGPTGGSPYEADIQLNGARLGSDAGLGVDLNIPSGAHFDLSITFGISSSTVTQSNDPRRGAALGFFSSVALGTSGSSHGFNNFTGLVVDRAGAVRLIVGGANSGVVATVAGFDPAVFHTLSYSVDTTAGAGTLSNILLDGTAVSLSAPVNTFTSARTVLAGFYYSDLAASAVATFDNFNVALVPEPSAMTSISIFFLLVAIARRRRGQRRHRV
jgi:hypothetical protein